MKQKLQKLCGSIKNGLWGFFIVIVATALFSSFYPELLPSKEIMAYISMGGVILPVLIGCCRRSNISIIESKWHLPHASNHVIKLTENHERSQRRALSFSTTNDNISDFDVSDVRGQGYREDDEFDIPYRGSDLSLPYTPSFSSKPLDIGVGYGNRFNESMEDDKTHYRLPQRTHLPREIPAVASAVASSHQSNSSVVGATPIFSQDTLSQNISAQGSSFLRNVTASENLGAGLGGTGGFSLDSTFDDDVDVGDVHRIHASKV